MQWGERSAQGAISNARTPHTELASALHPPRAGKESFSTPAFVSAEWWVAPLLEEGKVAQGHRADPLLHPPPPLRSSFLPSPRACTPERCRRAVPERPRCPAPRSCGCSWPRETAWLNVVNDPQIPERTATRANCSAAVAVPGTAASQENEAEGFGCWGDRQNVDFSPG